MNRRNFLSSLAAMIAAPALPLRALATAPAAAVVPPPNLYTWSAAIARTQGRCSPDMLMRMLHVDGTQAATLFNRLISNNVVGPVNALGVSQAKSLIPPPTGIPATGATKPAISASENKSPKIEFSGSDDDGREIAETDVSEDVEPSDGETDDILTRPGT